MKLSEFKATLVGDDQPSGDWPPLLQAMWWDAQHDWHRSHEIAQDEDSDIGSWVHAYLHRREGDASNARYWYRRAGRPVYIGSLEQEWEEIVVELIDL